MVLFIRCKYFLESSKWNDANGSKLSNNDGTWGLGKGTIDGSSRCGIQSEIFWGHENCGGAGIRMPVTGINWAHLPMIHIFQAIT